MLFVYSLTIPASTTQAAPTTDVVAVTHGVLREVMVAFPPGAAALAHVAVQYHEHQIIPVNPGESLAWDDVVLDWDEEIAVFERPFEFKLLGWNEDDTYPHTVTFHFNILEPAPPRAGNLVQQLFGSLVPGRGR